MSSRNGDRDVKTRALKNKTGKMRGGDMKKNNNKTLSVLATKQLQSAPSTFSTFSANPDNSMSFNEVVVFVSVLIEYPTILSRVFCSHRRCFQKCLRTGDVYQWPCILFS